MKLTYIFNGRLPTEKAHGVQVVKMCEAFANAGLETELVLPFRKNKIKENILSFYGVKPVFKIKKLFAVDPLVFVPGFSERIAFYIQSFSSVISILVYLLFKNRKGIFYSRDYAALFALSLFGFSPIAEIHDYRAKRKGFFIKYILKKSQKIIFNSEGTKKTILEHYRIDEKKMLVAPNGVDLDYFDVPETKEESREKLAMPKDNFIISYVGRLETLGMEKGTGYLLEAYKMISEEFKEACIYIIGGPDHLIDKYRNFIPKELKNRVFFTGQVKYTDIPVYLNAIDCVVVPFPKTRQFQVTASPIKIFEFMASGKIIIASRLESLTRYLNDDNSILFEPEQIEDLAEKMRYLLSHKNECFELGRRAKSDAANYQWINRARNIFNFIRN